MKFNGIEISDKVFGIVQWDTVRLAIRWVLQEAGLPEDALKGLTIKVIKNKQTAAGQYNPRNHTITLYQNHLFDKWFALGVLVHELVHAVQHFKSGYGFKAIKPEFTAVKVRYAGAKSKYFSQPIELEAYALQYKFLRMFNQEGIMQYFFDEYLKRGVDLSKF